jgi:hypothetical protein
LEPRVRTILSVTRDEYVQRRRELRPLLDTFRKGRMEIGGSGGAQGMLFVHTPDGKEWFVGGANDPAVARAIALAVNFALDLCETPDTP